MICSKMKFFDLLICEIGDDQDYYKGRVKLFSEIFIGLGVLEKTKALWSVE